MNASITQRRLFVALIVASLTLVLGAVDASAQLVNGDFDNAVPGPGIVGGFGTVVGPPFQPGFWGAENASIVTAGGGPGGPIVPAGLPNMLEMRDDGLTVTQAWQVINVTGSLPPNPAVSFSALMNSSTSVPGVPVQGVVRIHTFVGNWPVSSMTASNSLTLDTSAQSWEPNNLPLTPIPANTNWILAEVYFVNSTLVNSANRAYVDEARLTIASIPEPSSCVLAAFGLSAVGLGLRRRMKANA
jgi:hypothetical protein